MRSIAGRAFGVASMCTCNGVTKAVAQPCHACDENRRRIQEAFPPPPPNEPPLEPDREPEGPCVP